MPVFFTIEHIKINVAYGSQALLVILIAMSECHSPEVPHQSVLNDSYQNRMASPHLILTYTMAYILIMQRETPRHLIPVASGKTAKIHFPENSHLCVAWVVVQCQLNASKEFQEHELTKLELEIITLL